MAMYVGLFRFVRTKEAGGTRYHNFRGRTVHTHIAVSNFILFVPAVYSRINIACKDRNSEW
jgi:hypothetical protein